MTTNDDVTKPDSEDVEEPKQKTIDELARMTLSDMTEEELKRWTEYVTEVKAAQKQNDYEREQVELKHERYLTEAQSGYAALKESFDIACATRAEFSAVELI